MLFAARTKYLMAMVLLTGGALFCGAEETIQSPESEEVAISSVLNVHTLTDNSAGLTIRLFETGGGDPAVNGNFLFLTIVADGTAQESLTWKTGINVYIVEDVTLDADESVLEVNALEHYVESDGRIQERPATYLIDYDVDARTGVVANNLKIARRTANTGAPVIDATPIAEPVSNKCYRTRAFSEEGSGKGVCVSGYAVRGITCAGDYCDSMALTCCSFDPPDDGVLLTFNGARFSEELKGPRLSESASTVVEDENVIFETGIDDIIASIADKPKLLTGLSCSGRYCDNLTPQYTISTAMPVVARTCGWDDDGSEEQGFMACPPGKFVAGLRCHGRFCDAVSLQCCAATATKKDKLAYSDAAVHARALKFAPVLYFDQAAVGQKHCLVADPVDFYENYLAPGATSKAPKSVNSFPCNNDPESLSQVPVYYDYQRHGDSEYFMYWLFYDKQNSMQIAEGHIADWERVMVKVTHGMLAKVMYFAHSGWTTKMAGYVPMENQTQMKVFVGKVQHGSFMNTGGSGTFAYWGDFRNPGDDPVKFNTALNLKRLPPDADWVRYDGGWNFVKNDSVKGPARGENFSEFQVCYGNFVSSKKKPWKSFTGGGCTNGHNMGSGTF